MRAIAARLMAVAIVAAGIAAVVAPTAGALSWGFSGGEEGGAEESAKRGVEEYEARVKAEALERERSAQEQASAQRAEAQTLERERGEREEQLRRKRKEESVELRRATLARRRAERCVVRPLRGDSSTKLLWTLRSANCTVEARAASR